MAFFLLERIIIWNKKKKEKINVVFLVSNMGMWKCDELFKELLKDNRYVPHILIVKDARLSIEDFELIQDEIVNHFDEEYFSYTKAYDYTNNSFNDLMSLKPDVVFFQQPYITKNEQFDIRKIIFNAIILYVPYTAMIEKSRNIWNTTLQNIAYRLFYPTYQHKIISKKSMTNKGANIVVTGYPFYENLRKTPADATIWKVDNPKIKRVIWAPHHSILKNDLLNYSNFLEIADEMLVLAAKYREQLQFAFKPHPHLKEKLMRDTVWGRERTLKYYRCWSEMENTFYTEGEYSNLFKTSDALVHDCSTFSVEYLMTGNPVFYLSKEGHTDYLNEIGLECYEAHYKGEISDLEDFLINVVIGEHDTMKEKRLKTIQKLAPEGDLFSVKVKCEIDNIFN